MQPSSDLPKSEIILTPLQFRTARAIESRFGSDGYVPGVFLPSEEQLAAELCVSRWTLRKALSHLLHEGKLVRVEGKRLRINPNHDQKLRLARIAGNYYFWAWNLQDPLVLEALSGFSPAIGAASGRVITGGQRSSADPQQDGGEAAFLCGACEDPACRGVVVWRSPGSRHAAAYRRVMESGIPLIFFDMPAPKGIVASYVGPAHQRDTEHLVENLISLGHTRIACAWDGVEASLSTMERRAGFIAAVRTAGLAETCPILVPRRRPSAGAGSFSPMRHQEEQLAFATDIIEQAAGGQTGATALVSLYDTSARFLMAAAARLGVRVPEDLSIAGFAIRRQTVFMDFPEPTGPEIDYRHIGAAAGHYFQVRASLPDQALALIHILSGRHDGGTVRSIPS